MRHIQHIIETARTKGRIMGLKSQENRFNDRLQAALDFSQIRPIESYLVYEIIGINPRTGRMVCLELCHDVDNGVNRYNLYMDGKKIGRQWSRWGFCQWLFDMIDCVRNDWS